MKNYIKLLVIGSIVFLFTPACTDLDENIYSTLIADDFYKSEEQIILAMGNAYSSMQLRGTSPWGLFGAQEVSSDEVIPPFRTSGAFLRNNNLHLNNHEHKFDPGLPSVFGSWDFSFNTIAACNQIIFQIERATIDEAVKSKFVAELKVLRAFNYYVAMDLFGNIPVSLDFADTDLPTQSTRSEVFEIIERELLENIPLIDETPTTENYGRATQALGYAVLAKMYVNAEKWLGVQMWDKAIEACDNIINGGNYSLANDYFDNFIIENQGSPEILFAIPYDRRQGFGFMIHSITLDPSFREVYNYSAPIWNGMSTTEEFYNLYEDGDLRKKGWLVGEQFNIGGEPLLTTNNQTVNFTPFIAGLRNAAEDAGARQGKWEFTPDLEQGQTSDNDFTFFRYADILLIKAEALMRKNGGSSNAEAVNLVNQVRERAFGGISGNYTVATLTLDELIDERGRELSWEGHRRQDLIRFGKWQDAWIGKEANLGASTELMPIPQNALSANPNLTQNLGY